MAFKLSIHKFLFSLYILSFFFCLIQATDYTEESMKHTDVGSVGAGVFAVIFALVVGVIVCIFGLSTVMPGVFIAIGVCLPTCIFLFFAFCPLKDDTMGDTQSEYYDKNTHKNRYIVWRWLYFSVMLACVLALLAPLCILWNVMVIPQRVDSRAQKAYDERYKELLLKEMEKKEMEEKMKKEQENSAVHAANNNVNNENNEMGLNNFNTYQNPALNVPGKNEMTKKKLLRRKNNN